MVNRIWHHLFGKGIVPTVDNFGIIGKPPTHPELLDMLTLRFTDTGWSVKSMVRAIVLSRAYQLSSQPDEHNSKLDPDNRLLWRATPRRLEAETIRDAILMVSGQLDLQRPVGSTVTGLGDNLAGVFLSTKYSRRVIIAVCICRSCVTTCRNCSTCSISRRRVSSAASEP